MSTEQLPPQPTVTLGKGKSAKQHLQVWFTWADTQAYALQAIAADRARREVEADPYRHLLADQVEAIDLEAFAKALTWMGVAAPEGGRQYLVCALGGLVNTLVRQVLSIKPATHPATDASQAEQAAMRKDLREASKRDYTISFRQKFWPAADGYKDAHEMYSYERVSSMFWSAFMNGLINAGMQESAAVEYLQSKSVRWLLDGRLGDDVAVLAYRTAMAAATTKEPRHAE